MISKLFAAAINNPNLLKNLRGLSSRMIICNSFWGLDAPRPIPPNVIMTGPLMKRETSVQLASLEKKDAHLFAWMNDA